MSENIPTTEEIQATIRFFQLVIKSSDQELRSVIAEEVSDIEYSGTNVLTFQDVKNVLEKVENGIKQINQQQNEKISKLVGSLCMQLITQARSQGAQITPKPMELEDEKVIKMFAGGQQVQSSNMAKISDTTLLNNEEKIIELQKEISEKDKEIKKLNELLSAKVNQAPQFINLKKMLRNKEEEIERLQEELQGK